MVEPYDNSKIAWIETHRLADAIITVAGQRIERGEKYQNMNAAIHGTLLDVKQIIMNEMDANNRAEGK